MKTPVRGQSPSTMLHHVKEIQLRLLATVLILIAGMVVGYMFYEQLFQFIKAPLHGPLHYTSPAGSFSFVIKICLMVGIIATIPVAVYNVIMFVQPALVERLSRLRVYITTLMSLLLAAAGAAFAFLVIIPMALEFFFKFQVDGLEALISADDYLQFVVNVIITFVLIFQMPLLLSLIDHITPLPPKKLLKAEKFIIVGSIAVGVLVPFALDPVIQLLIASPIIILYNVSIGIIMLQHLHRKRLARRNEPVTSETSRTSLDEPQPLSSRPQAPVMSTSAAQPGVAQIMKPQPSMQSIRRARPAVASMATARPRSAIRPTPVSRPQVRLISDVRRPSRSTPAAPRPELGSAS